MNLQLGLSLVGALAAILAALPALAAYRNSARRRGTQRFRENVNSVERDGRELTASALADSAPEWRLDGWPMLTRRGWLPQRPYDLAAIQLDFTPQDDEHAVSQSRSRAARMFRRLGAPGAATYSSMLRSLGNMTHLFDGRIYRVLDIAPDARRFSLTTGSYFDYLDTSEVLAYEYAHRYGRRFRPAARSYRSSLSGPDDFRSRVVSLGIDTLTVRRGVDGAGFFLHQRDPQKVVNNSNMIAVTPAGEFAPSNVTNNAIEEDLDLWRNIMREFAEEFLGHVDAQGKSGRWIDYERESPYKKLNRARADGAITVSVLGLGIDPLNWKPELLTVCVIDAATFDEIFADMVEHNDEGWIWRGKNERGIPFNESNIALYTRALETSPNTRACLELAWRHREALGLAG